MQGAFIFHLT